MKNFEENTFVCFIDISGFKVELQNNLHSAGNMLDIFYSAGYNVLQEHKSLNGIFVSDCGIIYPHTGTITNRLENLLLAVKKINQRMLESNYLTTASIAYGFLEYRRKFVFNRMKKNAIIGSGYLNSFLDNEYIQPKLKPGQVRVTKQLDDVMNAENLFHNIKFNRKQTKLLKETETHYYFNWLSENIEDEEYIERAYFDFSNDPTYEKYEKLKLALHQILAQQPTNKT
jgi:hypothetical protein